MNYSLSLFKKIAIVLSIPCLCMAIPLLADVSLSVDNQSDEDIVVTPFVGPVAYPSVLVTAQTLINGQTPQQATAISINGQSVFVGNIATVTLSSSQIIEVDFSSPTQIILINVDEHR